MKVFIFLHILVIGLAVYFTKDLWEAFVILFFIAGVLEMIFFNYLGYKIKKENKESQI